MAVGREGWTRRGLAAAAAVGLGTLARSTATRARERPRRAARSETLSVVVPVLNEESALPACLRFLGSIDGLLEVVVVDGGSMDGTKRAFRKSRRDATRGGAECLLVETKVACRAKQMNAGARAARGDRVLFLHADTIVPVDSAMLISRAFSKDSRVRLAAFRPIMRHEGRTMRGMTALHVLKTRLGPLLFRPLAALAGLKLFFGDQAMVVQRDHFLSLGGFNEDMDIMEDMDLCVKMFYGIDGDSSDSDRTSLRQVRRVPRRQRQHQGGTLAQIEGRAETSGRRVAEWGALRSLQVYLVLSLSYAFGASPRALNQLARREYTEVR